MPIISIVSLYLLCMVIEYFICRLYNHNRTTNRWDEADVFLSVMLAPFMLLFHWGELMMWTVSRCVTVILNEEDDYKS